MTGAEAFRLSDPFRASAWLIAAYVVHLAEEWFGGFPEWSRTIRGAGVSEQEFLVINGVALGSFLILAGLVRRRPQMEVFPAVLAAIFVINGVLHALATLRYGAYSPGTVSGLLLFIPVGAMVLRAMRKRLSPGGFVAALVAGGLVHVFVTWVAFR